MRGRKQASWCHTVIIGRDFSFYPLHPWQVFIQCSKIVVFIAAATLLLLCGYYCPFDISWKDVFCLAFYFKWKYFVLIDHILSENICLFCFCVLFSNIYTKMNLRPKVGLTYAISVVKWFFGIFVLENMFYFSLLTFNDWCSTTILWKFQKIWTRETCWKSGSKLPTLQISAWFGFIFTMGKSENIWLF